MRLARQDRLADATAVIQRTPIVMSSLRRLRPPTSVANEPTETLYHPVANEAAQSTISPLLGSAKRALRPLPGLPDTFVVRCVRPVPCLVPAEPAKGVPGAATAPSGDDP